MDITKEILRRATIQGITEYLLYGSAIEAKQTELDSANEMASEVSEVYTALGLQAGMKIMQELLKGMNR